jgi:hypothetical protein
MSAGEIFEGGKVLVSLFIMRSRMAGDASSEERTSGR